MGARGALKLPSHLRPVPAAGAEAESAADEAPRVAPVKPKAVSSNKALSELWDEVVAGLDAAGLVAPSDGPAIELMLRHFLLARRASNSVTQIAIDDSGHNGGLKKHPAEAVFRAESDMFLRYAQQLGMTFVSRARTPGVKADEDGGANPFSAPAAAGS